MEEIWKDIKDYEGLYMVSSLGRVKSVERIVQFGLIKRVVKERIKKPKTTKNGYIQIDLFKDGKHNFHYIHRLVAKAFIPNPNNLPQVNHKNEEKDCNIVWVNKDGSIDYNKSNLEWCDGKYNSNYGNVKTKIGKKISKPVLQFSKDGELIRKWGSAKETETQGFYPTQITKCCKCKSKTTGGYIWKYYDKETYLIGIMNNNIKKGAA